MDALREMALAAYDDRTIGLELADIAVDGCITKAPCAVARRQAKARWIGESKVSNAPRRWMGRASP
jgi:hypothetical protein